MNHDPALRPAFAPPWQVRDSDGPGLAGLGPTQGSGDVVSRGRSDGFSEVPPERAGARPWPFYSWES